VRVHWTHTAIAHLLAIYEHIARDAPLYPTFRTASFIFVSLQR
jgi:hypothetical protein